MTSNRARKDKIRAEMARTGVTYNVARRALDKRNASTPLLANAARKAVTVTVASATGGSGKSTTALMLAAQVAQSSAQAGQPLKVLLVDMDVWNGQVATLVGRYSPTALNIRVAPEWNEETILRHLVHNEDLGIDALLAPVRPRAADDVTPKFYRHVIQTLQRTHDVVILDTSSTSPDVLRDTVCFPESDEILLVTTSALTSVQRLARDVRLMTAPTSDGGLGISATKIGVVLNQSAVDVGMTLEQAVPDVLGVRHLGTVPLATENVLAAMNCNGMHRLLRHPLLGESYFRLARACLKNAGLAPLLPAHASSDGLSPNLTLVAHPGVGDRPDQIGLGVSVDGPLVWDLSVAPHALIAGHTGTGKSVLQRSVLFHALSHPEDWSIVGIDLQGGVELGWLSGHRNVRRVAVTLEDAVTVLEDVREEMHRRYDLMRDENVNRLSKLSEPLPALLVLVDEAFTLLAAEGTRSDEGKDRDHLHARAMMLVTDLARLAWRAGIHLVLGTQRPSITAFPGELRSNLGFRVVAGRVSETESLIVLRSPVGSSLPKIKGRGLAVTLDEDPVEFHAYLVSPGSVEDLRAA